MAFSIRDSKFCGILELTTYTLKVCFLDYSSCDELRKVIHDFGGDDSGNYKGDIPYPHNVLRNVARRGGATKFVFLIDVDVAPSLNIRENFNRFALQHSLYSGALTEKVVFVVPVFEIKKGLHPPTTKNELIKGYTDKEIRPFHNAVRSNCNFCSIHNFRP